MRARGVCIRTPPAPGKPGSKAGDQPTLRARKGFGIARRSSRLIPGREGSMCETKRDMMPSLWAVWAATSAWVAMDNHSRAPRSRSNAAVTLERSASVSSPAMYPASACSSIFMVVGGCRVEQKSPNGNTLPPGYRPAERGLKGSPEKTLCAQAKPRISHVQPLLPSTCHSGHRSCADRPMHCAPTAYENRSSAL